MYAKAAGVLTFAAIALAKAQDDGSNDKDKKSSEGTDDPKGDEKDKVPDDAVIVDQLYFGSADDGFRAAVRMECYSCNDFETCSEAMDALGDPTVLVSERVSEALAELDDGCDTEAAKKRGYMLTEADAVEEENQKDFEMSARLGLNFYVEEALLGFDLRVLCDSEESAVEARKLAFETGTAGYMTENEDEATENPDSLEYTLLMYAVEKTEGCQSPSEDICSKCEGKEDQCRQAYQKMSDDLKDGNNLALIGPAWVEAGCARVFDGDLDEMEQDYAQKIPEYGEFLEETEGEQAGQESDSSQSGQGSDLDAPSMSDVGSGVGAFEIGVASGVGVASGLITVFLTALG